MTEPNDGGRSVMSDVKPISDAYLSTLRKTWSVIVASDELYAGGNFPIFHVDTLSSIIARLDAAEAERDRYKREIEDFKTVDRLEMRLRSEIRNAEAERDRLREALERFRVDDVSYKGMHCEEGDCWTDPVVRANRLLRELDASRPKEDPKP